MALRVSGYTLFGAHSNLSVALGCLFVKTQKVVHQKFYTQHTMFSTQGKNFKIKNILIHWLSHNPPMMLSPLPISGIILKCSGP
jgi:hypothetical protein